jgi:hypothetical protein
MEREEVQSRNITIAKFDGWKIENVSPFAKENGRDDIFDWKKEVRPNTFASNYGNSFNYNTSWDWLMPVVQKINDIHNEKKLIGRDLQYTIGILLGGGYFGDSKFPREKVPLTLENLWLRVYDYIDNELKKEAKKWK